MKNNIQIITTHLEQVVNSEPAPAFMSQEFRDLVSATSSIAGNVGRDPIQDAIFEAIGRRAVSLLLDRLMASMSAERTLSIMRGDNPNQVC